MISSERVAEFEKDLKLLRSKFPSSSGNVFDAVEDLLTKHLNPSSPVDVVSPRPKEDPLLTALYRVSMRVSSSAATAAASSSSSVSGAAKKRAPTQIKTGIMQKKKIKSGAAPTFFKRRHFVLNQNFLYYFKNASDTSAPLGFLDLQTTAVKPISRSGGGKRGRGGSAPAGSLGDGQAVTADSGIGPLEFVLIGVNGSWVMRASTDEETRAWHSVLESVSQKRLLKGMGLGRDSFSESGGNRAAKPRSRPAGPSRLGALTSVADETAVDDGQSELQAAWSRELAKLRALPSNQTCADCGQREPTWASINLGVFICLDCAGAHRHLGVSHSKVRSLDLDDWTGLSLVAFDGGNETVNRYWEAKPCIDKPTATASAGQRLAFIQAKYVKKLFIADADDGGGVTKPTQDSAPAQQQQQEGAAAAVSLGPSRSSSTSASSDDDDSSQPPPPPPAEFDDDEEKDEAQETAPSKSASSTSGSRVGSVDALTKNKLLVKKVMDAIVDDLENLLAAVSLIRVTDDAISLANLIKELKPSVAVLSNNVLASDGGRTSEQQSLSLSSSSSTQDNAGGAAGDDRLAKVRSVLCEKTNAYIRVFKQADLRTIQSQEELLVILQPVYSIRRSLQKLGSG